MKKILPLAFVLILTIGVLSSCTQKQEEARLEELASMKSPLGLSAALTVPI